MRRWHRTVPAVPRTSPLSPRHTPRLLTLPPKPPGPARHSSTGVSGFRSKARNLRSGSVLSHSNPPSEAACRSSSFRWPSGNPGSFSDTGHLLYNRQSSGSGHRDWMVPPGSIRPDDFLSARFHSSMFCQVLPCRPGRNHLHFYRWKPRQPDHFSGTRLPSFHPGAPDLPPRTVRTPHPPARRLPEYLHKNHRPHCLRPSDPDLFC